MNFCPFEKYKHILGIPNKGAHKYRFLDTAIVDYIFTILLSIFTTFVTKVPLVLTTIFWFIIGIIAHFIFGLKTNTIKYLGLSCKKLK